MYISCGKCSCEGMLSRTVYQNVCTKKYEKANPAAFWNMNYPTFSACLFPFSSIWQRLNKTNNPTGHTTKKNNALVERERLPVGLRTLNIIFTLGASSRPFGAKVFCESFKNLSNKINIFATFFSKTLTFCFWISRYGNFYVCVSFRCMIGNKKTLTGSSATHAQCVLPWCFPVLPSFIILYLC